MIRKDGLSINYAKETIYELATSTVFGAGLGFIGPILSRIPRSNQKIVWNSPSSSNPLPFRLVDPGIPTSGLRLLGTAADTTGASLSRNGGGVLKAGSVEIQIPLAQSKTTELASTWLIEQAKKIPQMLNKTATLREQAIQAVTIKSALVTAARNSMQNASAAIQLGITNPVRSYNEIVNQFKDKYAGNSLYKKVMTEAVDEASLLRSVESPNFCFAAGTLVHTKDGLKPIEQIKLGDWVLSKPEGSSGEQAYKRVTRTVSFEDKEIWLVRFYKSGDDIEQIGVTANHPFWLANGGWTRADQLGMGSVIELADLSLGDILCSTPLYKTEKEGVALAYRAWGLEDVDGAMSEVDLIDAEIVVSEENYFSAENQRFTGKDF